MAETVAEISWDDIKQMLAQLAQQTRETGQMIRELREQSRETDRRMQETDRRMQETDRRMQETDRRLQETGQMIRELREQSRETDRKLREVSAQLGRLGRRLGEFVEEMVEPAVVRLFQERGWRVHRTMQNLECRDDEGRVRAEVDLLVINQDTAIAVECKSHLSVEDVREHVERLGVFKECWPEYAPYRLLGAVAAMVVPEDAARYAYRQGLYVLAPSGETMRVLNNAPFEPRIW